MENVNHVVELHRVDRPVSAAVEILDDFQHACAAESLQGLGVRVLRPPLRGADGEAENPLDRIRHGRNIVEGRADENAAFFGQSVHLQIAGL